MDMETSVTSVPNRPPALAGAPRFSGATPRAQPQTDEWRDTLAAAATMAVWLGCLIIGILGLVLNYGFVHLPAPPPPPVVEVNRLTPPAAPVETPKLAPPSDAMPPPAEASEPQPPPPPELAAPEAPPLAAVAEPSPAISFAVPVEGPTRIVDARQAIPPAPRAAPAPAPVKHLTFGVGEGRQADPEYPRDAILAHEQGTVVIRFVTGEDGRVQSAEVTQPCRWPLLNQAALQAVRGWRLPPNSARHYEIPIEFRINER